MCKRWDTLEIIVHVIQGQLLVYAVLALAQRGNATPNRRHMVADAQVEALNERGVDVPATRRSHVLDGFQSAKHHPVPDTDETTPTGGFDHLRIPQPGQRHPTRFG